MNASFAQPPFVSRPVRDYGRIVVGLIILAIGVLFLLDSAGALNAGTVIGDYWPAVLIVVAVAQLAERVHGVAGPVILLAAGTLLLLVTAGAISGNVWDYVWPTAIVVAGLFILSRWRGSGTVATPVAGDDTVVASGIFGGPTIASASQSFRGGSLTAIFGGVTLDLRSAQLAEEGAAITATTAFGGVEILVPRGWRIAVKATPIFGGVEDKTDHSAALGDDAPILRIDAVSVFGGVEVKHHK